MRHADAGYDIAIDLREGARAEGARRRYRLSAVLSPFVAYGVEAGLRYSDSSAVEARPKRVEDELGAALGDLNQRPAVPFNRMAEWGPNGRITAGAAVHSPFIRRKQHLDLA
jgi:NAD(P)H dehydrogenase (quinone)